MIIYSYNAQFIKICIPTHINNHNYSYLNDLIIPYTVFFRLGIIKMHLYFFNDFNVSLANTIRIRGHTIAKP